VTFTASHEFGRHATGTVTFIVDGSPGTPSLSPRAWRLHHQHAAIGSHTIRGEVQR